MVGANKILTVSYGTFSCTLEGFDDPFSTMRAIAEYFRDLAADDRYFGAEPPTPDAAMLHRIAERELQRRVEARVEENGVTLRAGDAASAPAPSITMHTPAPAAPAAPSAAPSAATEAAAPRAAPSVAPAALASPAPATAALTGVVSGIEDSVAAKLARIRSAVDRGRAPAPLREIEDAQEVITPPPAAAAIDSPGIGAATAAHATPAPAPATPSPATPAPATPAPAVIEEAVIEDAEEDVVAALADLPELAVAAPLITEPAVTEPEAVEPVSTEVTPKAAAALTAAPLTDEADTFDADDFDLEGFTARLPEATAGATKPTPAADDDDAEDDADLTILLDEITAQTASAKPAPELTPEVVAEPAAKPAAQAPVVEDAALEAATPDPVAEPVAADAPVPPLRARVIKVRRIEPARAPEPEPATPDSAVDTDTRADDPTEDPVPAIGALLSPEEEDELARELAAVEREMSAPAPQPTAPARRAALPTPATQEDAAVSRLLRQTDTELAGPETRRRAATIAHLKAAVAATVADGDTKRAKAEKDAEKIEPYRDDLAQAVRPRRPEAVAGTGQRRVTSDHRVPPLVLVSEQRIDRPAAATAAAPAPAAAPVRPRRVTSGSLALTRDLSPAVATNLDEDDNDLRPDTNPDADARFSAFAQRLGSTGLPDLIEAAAAYVTVIGGRETFTRPQLIRLAGTFSGADISREDGLRSFGLLLRDGRIEKARRGQFAMSPTSRLLAEARKFAD